MGAAAPIFIVWFFLRDLTSFCGESPLKSNQVLAHDARSATMAACFYEDVGGAHCVHVSILFTPITALDQAAA